MRHLLVVIAFTAACSDRPSDAELDRWRGEAVALNSGRLAAAPKQDFATSWTVTVQGRVGGAPLRLSMAELDALATARLSTAAPNNTQDFTEKSAYRGVPVATLLDRAGVPADARDVTIVGFDGFRATIPVADARKYPGIMLAVEKDGKPFARGEGGPVAIVFPWSDHPAMQKTWEGRFWCWYVTDLVVDTEPALVRVGGKAFDAAALAALDQTTIVEEVGYKVNWPAHPIPLHGVRLDRLLSAAGVELADGARVIVKGKAPKDHDAKEPVAITAANVKAYDILLVTHWGEDKQPVPAHMGGPLTLAYPGECKDEHGEKRWVTFVQEIEVVAAP